MSQHEPDQLRWEWLTTTVSVRGLCRSILQAVQDLAFAHVAVSYQEELQQVVVAFHWAALAAHPVSHGGRGSSLQEAEGETKQHPYALLFPDTQSVMPWMSRMRVWESLFCLLTVFKTVGSLISGKEKKWEKGGHSLRGMSCLAAKNVVVESKTLFKDKSNNSFGREEKLALTT